MIPNYEGRIANFAVVDVYTNALIKELKLSRLRRYLNIAFVDTIDDGQTWGICHGETECAFIEIARKDLTRNMTFLERMKVLAHEMVHAKQYFRGELEERNRKQYWKGELAESYNYYTAPWEQEARDLENVLFCKLFPFHMSFKN
jgi:hypothetical protein